MNLGNAQDGRAKVGQYFLTEVQRRTELRLVHSCSNYALLLFDKGQL